MTTGRKSKKQKTPTLVSNYEREFKHNAKMAEKWLKMLFPQLHAVWLMLVKFGIDMDDIITYIYSIHMVKSHGYGSVQTTIFEHKITKTEALVRTLKQKEMTISI